MTVIRTILTWIRFNISIIIIVIVGLIMMGLYLDIRHASALKDKQINALITEARKKDDFIKKYQQDTDEKITALSNLANDQHSGLQTLIEQLKAVGRTPAVDAYGHTTTTTTPKRPSTTTTQPKQSPPPTTPPNSPPPSTSLPPSSPPPSSPPPSSPPPSPPPSQPPVVVCVAGTCLSP